MTRINLRSCALLLAAALLLVSAAGPARADIVYIGQDASVHWDIGFPEGATLGANAVRFAASGAVNPTIAVIESSDGFGGSAAAMLASEGFTMVTVLTPAMFATATLSDYQVLYFEPTTDSGEVAIYASRAADIAAYAAADGGLVVEPEVFAAGSWEWVPFAGLIGHSGATNVGGDDITILAPGHPVMAGLTDAGLSNWGFSAHTTFDTPEAAGFVRLTEVLDVGGSQADIIALEVGAAAVPEPATLTLCGMGLLSLGGYALRRRKAARA
jgi:hypothetical protein